MGICFGDDWLWTEAVGLVVCLGVSHSSARAEIGSDDMLFREELEEANLQLV